MSMSSAGTIGWFARHETRLAWRDWQALMTLGRRRTPTVVLGFTVFAIIMHGMAWLMLYSSASLAGSADAQVLSSLTISLLLAWSLMLSQAMETVTRAFFARGDLELILTSPVLASRLFAVRLAAMAGTVVIMAVVLAAPFIHVLVWLGGARWFGGYVVAVALAINAAAVAIVVIVAMFHLLGAKRTRLISQIFAAVIGAAFAIALQFATIISYGSMPDTDFSQMVVAVGSASKQTVIRWPAPEFLADPVALTGLLGASVLVLAAVIFVFAPRFGQFAFAAGNVVHDAPARKQGNSLFRASSPAWALRRKEWVLLLRDPWLMSQTLMQLLYLLPAVFLLWRNFRGAGGSAMLVPILIVAAGQLGGGLAWLAVSGEDAPELIATAPMTAYRVLRAKTEAVLGSVCMIFAPLVMLFAVIKPFAALVAMAGILVAAGSSTAIQYWFRSQGRRSVFRRRQTSSRVATITEALSSTGWAATGALAVWGTWMWVFPAMVVLAIVAGTWMISPARSAEPA
jgi:ABC-2 type transport system permease protein